MTSVSLGFPVSKFGDLLKKLHLQIHANGIGNKFFIVGVIRHPRFCFPPHRNRRFIVLHLHQRMNDLLNCNGKAVVEASVLPDLL